MIREWVGFDLDGTLAHYESGNYHPLKIGKPIAKMVVIAKAWHAKKVLVKIVTARVCCEDSTSCPTCAPIRRAIQAWCKTHLKFTPMVTNRKDGHMVLLYDDRAVGVRHDNSGEFITPDEAASYLAGA